MATRSLQINIVGDPSSFSRAMRRVSRDADDGSKKLTFLSKSGDEVGSSLGNTTVRMGAFSGSIGTMLPQLAVAAPALLAVAGAGTAVAGSLAAAAGGATALGVGLGASLAPILVVGAQVKSRFDDIGKAYDALKTSQREGTAAAKKNADQALAALSKNERAMVGSLGRLSKLQTSVLGGASDRIIGSLSGAIDRVAPSLEKLAKPFDRLGDAIAGVITKASRSLSGSAWTGALKGFVDSATRLVRPFSRIFGSIANIVRDVATAALPLVSDAVKSVAGSFSRLDKAATGSKIRGVVRTLVGHTREWWGLIKEVGKLLFNVLNVGAKDGKGLVRSLTDIIKKWNAWLGTADGQRQMRKFIQDSIKTVRELARIVAFFGGAAVKASLIAIDAFVKIRPALRLVTRGLEPIVKLLTGDFSGAWRTAKRNATASVDAIRGAVRSLLGTMQRTSDKIVAAALNIGKSIVTGILGAFKGLAGKIAGKVTGAVTGAAGAVKGFLDKANPFGDGLGKEVAGSIGAGGVLPQGGAFGGSLMGAQAALRPVAAIGSRFGLNVSSGRRPGSITSSGNVSFHSSGEAIDEAGSPGGMMAFFKYMKGHFGGRLAELIYTPGGAGIKSGKPYTYGGQVAADHFDHVHVALDTGRPGVGDGIGYDALMRLWARAGGPASQANTAAAVALAESGGNASIVNSIGATGLWQIHPAEPGSKDPLTNARQAVRKFRESGWQPWEAYTGPDGKGSDGPYRRFLRSGSSRTGRSGPARLRPTSGYGNSVGHGRSEGIGNIGARGMGTGTAGGKGADYGTGGYTQGIANVGVEKAQATRQDDLGKLIGALQKEKRLKQRRLKRINRLLKRRLKKATRTALLDEKSQLLGDLTELASTLKEYRADAKGGATTISGAEKLDAGVDTQGVADAAQAKTDAAQAEADRIDALPTATDFANAAIAEAGLTPGLDDDIAATRSALDLAMGDLTAARASGDPRKISEAIGVWTSVNQSLQDLLGVVNNEAETRQRLIDATESLALEVKTQNEFSRSVAGIASREAVRALADVISGQIVGTNLQGRRLTAGNGVVAITP